MLSPKREFLRTLFREDGVGIVRVGFLAERFFGGFYNGICALEDFRRATAFSSSLEAVEAVKCKP